jgi:hypothetical protein
MTEKQAEHIEALTPDHVHKNKYTLGHHTVAISLFETGDNLRQFDNPLRQRWHEFRQSHSSRKAPIQSKIERNALMELPKDQRLALNRALSSHEASQFLKHTIGVDKEAPTPDYVAELIAKKADGSYKIDDEVWTNFLEWHQFNLVRQQRELDKQAPAIKQNFTDLIENAVDSGQLPKLATDNLSRLPDIPLIIDDHFMWLDSHTMGFHGGIRGIKDSAIILDPNHVADQCVLTHELLHAISSNNGGESNESGLEKLYPQSKYLATVFNEGMTQYLTTKLLIDTVESSAQEKDLMTTYKVEQALVGGIFDVDPTIGQELTELYFANGDTSERVGRVKERLRELFGENWDNIKNNKELFDTVKHLDKKWLEQLKAQNPKAHKKYASHFGDKNSAEDNG